jgi:hypothetical protein
LAASSEWDEAEEDTRSVSSLFITRSVPTEEEDPLRVLSSMGLGSDQSQSRQNSTAMLREEGGSSSS